MSNIEEKVVSTDVFDVGETVLASSESLKEGLRRQRESNLQNETLNLALPEYTDPELVGQYRMVDPSELAAIGEKLKREFKNRMELVTYGAIDSIIAACVGLYARPAGSKELISLDEGIPLRFDSRLADYLGIEATTAREVVIQTFGANMYAIIDHNVKITRWMGDRKADLGDGLGEL
jgi:hypothetical protein